MPRYTSREQEELYRKLVDLAGDDPDIVEDALRVLNAAGETPTLEQLVTAILQQLVRNAASALKAEGVAVTEKSIVDRILSQREREAAPA